MKIEFIVVVVMICAVSIHAQRESVGVGSPAGFGPVNTSQGTYTFDEYNQRLKAELAGNQPFRVVNGKIYNVISSQLWQTISGEVHYITADRVLILYDPNGLTAAIALKNYSGDGTSGQYIHTVAIHTGTYDWTSQPLPLWDCGTPYVPPPLTPEQIKAAQQAAKLAAQRETQKQFLAQSNAVVWLQSQATNGDAGAQCSLGEHYLNGKGCQTNREQGVYWLKQAAVQGNVEASNTLANLQK